MHISHRKMRGHHTQGSSPCSRPPTPDQLDACMQAHAQCTRSA